MPYIHFTDRQKYQANHTDLVEFLQKQGEKIKRSGSEWEWIHADQKVTIRGNKWFHQYDREGGTSVSFVRRFYNKDYPEAVQMLLGSSCGTLIQHEQPQKTPKPFALPKAHSDMRRVYAYLMKQRFIDREVISYFAHNKLLYEGAEHHNAVFVGRDENGIPRHAHKRGTYSDSGYKGNVDGSLPEYSFHYIGTSEKLYVFEAPIDALSFITLHRTSDASSKDWQNHSYVALCCVAEHAAVHMLKQNPHIKTVILCLDHDKAGIEGCYRLAESIHTLGNYSVKRLQPQEKDWNEQLKAKNGIEPIPAEDHPAIAYIRELCSNLPDWCKYQKLPHYPLDALMTAYDKLKKLYPNQTEEITEQSLEMAGVAFLFAKSRYSQLEMTVTNEEIANKMFRQYKPHKDNGLYKSHIADIGYRLQSVIRESSEDRIYTRSEREHQINHILEIGMDCLRLHAFVTLHQEQTPVNQLVM